MTPSGESSRFSSTSSGDPLLNLATVRNRMDLIQRFLSDYVNRNALLGREQMDLVSSEIASAIHQIIVNGAALLVGAQHQTPDPPPPTETPLGQRPGSGSIRPDPKEATRNEWVEGGGGGDDVVEIDAVELLAEHIHRCEICGKGFKRDANLRMHMRAHGNQFKTAEALAKPQPPPPICGGGVEDGRKHAASSSSRFSCPFHGCNRNRMHRKFRPLKSVICVRNHFKRSHCPKTYACNRCSKKHFSVLADLKSHLRHCGESKWKCSCGTSFSRKDKLVGHMALFEGHTPAVAVASDDKSTATAAGSSAEGEIDHGQIVGSAAEVNSSNCSDNGFFEGLLEEFGAVDGYCWQDILESPTNDIGNDDNVNSVDCFLNF